jgi:DnaJ-class molecular chaperone
MHSALIVQCSECNGKGLVYVRPHFGAPSPHDHEEGCAECNGSGNVEARCDVCCHESATVETGDAELPFACEACAAKFEPN